uniref:ATP synthase D chain n=1 Tax=Rhizophora mucronata TaxID=61149 RepID=A0A2P2N7X0_RHIMU
MPHLTHNCRPLICVHHSSWPLLMKSQNPKTCRAYFIISKPNSTKQIGNFDSMDRDM